MFGRLVRFFLGITLALAIIQTDPSEITDPDGLFWFVIIYGLISLRGVFNMLLLLNWGRKPQYYAVMGFILVAVVDRVSSGVYWSPILGGLLYAVSVATTALSGASFILAAILRTPGCEWRAFPQLIAGLRGKHVQYRKCALYLHKIDKWEERRNESKGDKGSLSQ